MKFIEKEHVWYWPRLRKMGVGGPGGSCRAHCFYALRNILQSHFGHVDCSMCKSYLSKTSIKQEGIVQSTIRSTPVYPPHLIPTLVLFQMRQPRFKVRYFLRLHIQWTDGLRMSLYSTNCIWVLLLEIEDIFIWMYTSCSSHTNEALVSPNLMPLD